MKKPLFLLLFSFLVGAPAHSRELVDQVGRTVEVAEPLTRVVSLAPNLTEISYEVGGGEALVGATRFANFPEAAARLPKVGSYVALDIEKIVSLKPQLCLAIRDGNPKAVVDRLEALGIPVYVSTPKAWKGLSTPSNGWVRSTMKEPVQRPWSPVIGNAWPG